MGRRKTVFRVIKENEEDMNILDISKKKVWEKYPNPLRSILLGSLWTKKNILCSPLFFYFNCYLFNSGSRVEYHKTMIQFKELQSTEADYPIQLDTPSGQSLIDFIGNSIHWNNGGLNQYSILGSYVPGILSFLIFFITNRWFDNKKRATKNPSKDKLIPNPECII